MGIGHGDSSFHVSSDFDEIGSFATVCEVGLVAAAVRKGERPFADAEALLEERFYLLLVLSAAMHDTSYVGRSTCRAMPLRAHKLSRP
jgi:hypothetical protein